MNRQHRPGKTAEIDRAALTALLAKSSRGCELSFAEFYDRTSPFVYAVTLRIVCSPDHAAEVTQETYLQMWRQSHTFDPQRGSITGWVLTIARRRAIDRVRAVTSTVALESRYAVRTNNSSSPDMSEDVATRIDSLRVHEALSCLSAKQREVVVLRYFECHSLKEIAAQLGLPLGTVKTRLRDGLIRLRDDVGLEYSLPATG